MIPTKKGGRPKIHPDRKAYKAAWIRNKRAKQREERLADSKANH